VGQQGLAHVSAERTLGEWAELNGCAATIATDALPDTDGDGHHTERWTYEACEAPLVHLRVQQGGHTWPDGWQYLGEATVGPVERDWGDEVLWDFLSAHTLP
jgi:polyhydroxybutyrate depolymerase